MAPNDVVNVDQVSGTACFGISAVLRMTFALFCFHGLMIVLISPRVNCSAILHDGGWCFKFILVAACFIGFFWVPIKFFTVWAEISRYVSIGFFFGQVLYVLSGAYTFNDFMTGEEDEG